VIKYLNEVCLKEVILAIISISGAVAGIASVFTISYWDRLKSTMAKLESPYPLDVEIALREVHVSRFVIIPHIIAIFLLSINSIMGIVALGGQLLHPFTIFLISLFFFCTGLYSFLTPIVVSLKDDFYLIRLHERLSGEEPRRA